MVERLQKILSRAGVASRRASEELILQGRVSVNGKTVQELGAKADSAVDDIRLDDRKVKPTSENVYLLLNKPKGVVSTRYDPEHRKTVMDLVPQFPGLYPVGRLDYATEGLILLTNDGAFAERVAHPRYEVERRYQAKVKGTPTPETLARAKRGLVLDGERLSVDGARVIEQAENSWVEVRLHEGKHHEVRRLLQALGHPVEKLKRVGLGLLTSHGLDVGEFRSLTPREVSSFLKGRGNMRSDKFAQPTPAPFRPRTGPRKDATELEGTKPMAPARPAPSRPFADRPGPFSRPAPARTSEERPASSGRYATGRSDEKRTSSRRTAGAERRPAPAAPASRRPESATRRRRPH
ncbi:MAG: pseudouridine synthase [Vicinamibacteria bacterium]